MIKSWNDNQDLIKDYLQNRESFENTADTKNLVSLLGMSIGIFLVIFLVSIVLFFLAIYLLVVNWNNIPTWAKVIGIVSLFFFPLLTIVVVLIGKKEENKEGGYKLKSLNTPYYRFKYPVNYGFHTHHNHHRVRFR
jgi:energy-coupling factor transporter transmembrane protein EcfT